MSTPHAVPVSGFRQRYPGNDADPSFRTEFRVAYDAENLYVYVRAFDPHPDSIMRALSSGRARAIGPDYDVSPPISVKRSLA